MVIFFVALAFQNCSQVRYASLVPVEALKSNNNGGSYEGKDEGEYYRFVPDFTCAGQPAPFGFVTVVNPSITLTFNSTQTCGNSVQNLNPQQVDGSIYQKEVIGYLEGIYEKKSSFPLTVPSRIIEFWCRDRMDHQGIEVLATYDRLSDTTLTKIYYATENGDGTYTQNLIPEFPVENFTVAVSNKQTLRNDQLEFELGVHLDEPSLVQPGLYNSQIESVIQGQYTKRQALCRLGGRLDSR